MKNIICDKKEAILKAAIELIAEHGFHGAPTAMIAERAGVGAGTIYRYFENKDDLIKVLHQNFEGKLVPFLLDGYSLDQPVRLRFIHIGAALLRYFIGNPVEFRFWEQFINSPYGVEFRRDKIFGDPGKSGGCDIVQALFKEGVEKKLIKDLPLVVLYALFFAPTMALARDHILGFVILDEGLMQAAMESCWNAVKCC